MHRFIGKWISDEEFYALPARNVFHKQLEPLALPCDEHRNRHILFRKKFHLDKTAASAKIYISADDYYKLYINGRFVAQGPAPAYHTAYNYNTLDVTEFLLEGENLIAVHTLYQGLINRVWQSGDNRHGLLLDLSVDGEVKISSDESFLTAQHSAYREIGTVGYDTGFLEEYDSNASEVGFEKPDFDDSAWDRAHEVLADDHTVKAQESKMLVFENISPKMTRKNENKIFLDFGSNYVGYLAVSARGKARDTVTIRCAQELDDDGNVRFNLRANCKYEETWILGEGESSLDWFDYKSFRYAELILPEGCEIVDVHLVARHYPFELEASLKQEYASDENLKNIWNLCINTQKYGVQEVIQDCMEREKGFYVGDGCYTALTNAILTQDDSIVRKLIDDGFSSDFVTDSLVTCLNCSFMQEIAEYPLMLVYLVLWHYRLFSDREYLAKNYEKIVKLLESYRRDYGRAGLLSELDKWCVVEWPANFRDGYDVDLTENQVCHEAHISINSYYIEAIRTANKIAAELGLAPYRDEKPLYTAFLDAFYDKERSIFTDAKNTDHVSLIGNVTAFGLGLCPDEKCLNNIIKMIEERGISSVSLFGAHLLLMGYVRYGMSEHIGEVMLDRGAWLRMLREDATTTFEGWGKDTKWNTSLFHLTMSYGATFLADIDLSALFK